MKQNSDNIALPVLKLDSDRRAGTKMGRRRAIALIVVHLLVGVHIWFFLKYGSAFSPLEPSEAGHSISTGAINAGAIFFAILIISTLIFGRFFCGWACHVVAYQDAARWLLIKCGLRPKPVRARLLMLVPLFAVYWLFGRPLIARFTGDAHAHGESAGVTLALTTDDFWATFPGPVITILTFVICGFLVVYFLGAKGFCTYGCPYGAIFGISDRFAPGRIRVNENCDHTGNCTRTCSSNVNVAREVATYGMVVDPGCMKCMDCVQGCPNDALYFGFGSTALAKNKSILQSGKALTPALSHPRSREREKKIKVDRHYDLTWPEEIAAIVLFAIVFAVVYNLYRVVPLLMAIGASVALVAILLFAMRLVYRSNVSMQGWTMKRTGKFTIAGAALGGLSLLILAGLAHGVFLQYHTRAGLDAYENAETARLAGEADELEVARGDALAHLEKVDRYGIFDTRSVPGMRGEMARWTGDAQTAAELLQHEIDLGSRSADVRMLLGLAQLELEQFDAAQQFIERAFDQKEPARDRFARLDWELRRLNHPSANVSTQRAIIALRMKMLRRAVDIHPDFEDAAVQLCQLLARHPDPSQRDPAEAMRIAESVSDKANGRNATLLAMLAALQAMHEQYDHAADTAERAEKRALEIGDKEHLDLARDMRNMADSYRSQINSAESRP